MLRARWHVEMKTKGFRPAHLTPVSEVASIIIPLTVILAHDW